MASSIPDHVTSSPWQERERIRLLVEGVTDYAIFMLDPSGVILTWNAGAERIKQYSAAEVIGKHFSIFYAPEDVRAGKPQRGIDQAARTGRFEDEGWRFRKDGTRFWANVVITALREGGELRGFAKVTRDLTERRRAAEELRQSELRLRLLIESVRDHALFMLDTDGRIATWNAGAQNIKQYTAREIIGKHFSIFYPQEDVQGGKCEYELVVATKTGRFEEEGWRIRKDGSRFWANVVISAIRDEHGTLVGFAKVTRDLTARRRMQEEQAARLAAEEANRAKDEFLAMLGHELRNPLSPIVTALQLMKLRGEAGSSVEQEVIERQVKHMARLVEDLLDAARITQGKLLLNRVPVDLRAALATAVELASPLLEQRAHFFDSDVGPQEMIVLGDEARLAQIFANLLTNAAKYTEPRGHIAMTARRDGDEVTVEVRDDGHGIAPELLPKVFHMFVQGHQAADRPAGGLGIGLTLVRSLVELHGGSVEARSAGLGRGSTFTVRLPAATSSPTAAEDRAPALALPRVTHACRVLVVDDNEDALFLLADLLRTVGYEVRTANDGAAALRTVKTFTPDIAIVDIGLPVIDGYELAARLRNALGSHPLRLLALTGYGQAQDRERSKLAGFHTHLVKPVDVKELIATIEFVRST